MRKYDDEFKKEAIRKFLDGQSIASISRETGVSEGLLHKWKNKIIQKGTARWTGRSLKCESGSWSLRWRTKS